MEMKGVNIMSLDMNNRLRLLRKSTGKSQEEFGKIIGISKSGVSDIENGRRNVTEQHIKFLMLELNINEDWLRTGRGDMFIQLDKEDEITKWLGSLMKPDDDNEFIRRFVHMLSKLDISDWETLEKMALMMLEEDKEES